MNTIDDILKHLSSKRRVRYLFRDTHISDIEKIIKLMNSILEEKKHKHQAETAKLKARKKYAKEIQKLMVDKGLSLEDLCHELNSSTTTRRSIPTKHNFEYLTLSGDTVQWYGSSTGRVPRDFQRYLDKTGKNRMQCVLPNTSPESTCN
ncbi:DNA-binding protein H-NS, plasmid [invertebrate metagenome]|uniref:DNA-binding protein H-NS, plasmid n=1 Tax=invertebrate metagenome TaxID=1711999 RepID=A0A2H9TBN7_9ZZZZ